MNKKEREEREHRSLFADEKFAKKAWRQYIGTSLEGSATKLPTQYGKDGLPSSNSLIEEIAFKNLSDRLMADDKARSPSNAELMIECAIIRARYTDSTLNILLERTSGKVKEEIVMSVNPYEELTDEELELLQERREGNGDNT